MSKEIAVLRNLKEVIAEYDEKMKMVEETVEVFKKAGEQLHVNATIGGTYGNTRLDTGHVYSHQIKESLKRSAWKHVYDGLNMSTIASASDKRKFEQSMIDPPEFTMDNLRATFGDFIADPFGNILRGLAEVFSDLDPAYKSHDKVKIGVEGLPKRIILRSVTDYGSWGRDRLQNVLNALAAYQGKPLVTYQEIEALFKDPNALKDKSIIQGAIFPARGIRLKRFENGNGHLIFEPDTLRDINKALAQYYGEVLPDCHEEKPTKKQASTAVSKDLQYYPTPLAVVKRVLDEVYIRKGDLVLEPSCGCGRFLEALVKIGANAKGIEIDPQRVQQCRDKGLPVMKGNFLETAPTPIFDYVVMNPPFYGQHYAKHVEHAFKFLKEDGVLVAVLPITARYDHGLLDKGRDCSWSDLPVGSFRESGTNINTTIFTWRKRNR